ncbi:leucine-rich repeat receptor-like serine/threonine/tyrosine-protein kinase SOBIR1 [Tanacetum coccineum]|uniref:Leucine-rich repeat receptor-like serine/threonine/tyrosine-protein kinase SOBIR1 n=1 Tax=Tanacetum coccineum TaxID=301880 RepID=A0ABQ4X7E0_9ASTR
MGRVVGIFTGSVAGILSAFILLLLFNMVFIMVKNRGNYSGPANYYGASIFSRFIKAGELAFLEDDNAVSALTVVGRGGCGEVYRTDIPNEKIQTIAIKKITQPSMEGQGADELAAHDTKALDTKMRQIRSEIQTVGQIRHRNLVSLLAHVSRPNCHYLVYEFMKNGSLEDILQQVQAGERQLEWLARYKIAIGVASGLEYLHMSHTPRIVHRDLKPANVLLDDDMEARIADFGLAKSIPDANTHMTSSQGAELRIILRPTGERQLEWLARYKIAIGVASGLEYLHMSHTPRIVHRDLKPANVLLDDDMEARIADFGLAKLIPEADTHMTSSHVAGTIGYIAPEYFQTGELSEKCDIYSFGVLLGVLVMGKLPWDVFFQHTPEVGLVKWMRHVMTSDNPNQAIDPCLLGNGYEEQMLLVLKIACFCTLDNPKERPNSKDCRIMLAQIER